MKERRPVRLCHFADGIYETADMRFRVERIGDYTRGPNWLIRDFHGGEECVYDLWEARQWIIQRYEAGEAHVLKASTDL